MTEPCVPSSGHTFDMQAMAQRVLHGMERALRPDPIGTIKPMAAAMRSAALLEAWGVATRNSPTAAIDAGGFDPDVFLDATIALLQEVAADDRYATVGPVQ